LRVRREYAVSVHDVAPATWPQCERLLALADSVGAPVTLLVVPHYHRGLRSDADPAFGAAVRQRVARGDEVALHGYYHEDHGPPPRSPGAWLQRRVYTAAEGEFATLDTATAADLLARGRAVLTAIGIEPAGFVPPAWLINERALEAVRRSGLRYTCTRNTLIDFGADRPASRGGEGRIAAPSLAYSTRSPWRRALSRRWNRVHLAAFAHAPHLRVALHPADAGHDDVMGDWTRLVAAFAAQRRAVLESVWLA
jgi:uncharacterized protein